MKLESKFRKHKFFNKKQVIFWKFYENIKTKQ